MKRLSRILLIAALLSLLLCAATITLWIRSYRSSQRLLWASAYGSRCLSTAKGYATLSLFLDQRGAYPPAFQRPLHYQSDLPTPPFNYILLLSGEGGDRYSGWQFADFAWEEKRNTANQTLHGFAAVPFWSLTLLTAFPALAWTTLRLLPRRRRPDGLHCTTCGYDLRATPTRCPECGTTTPANRTPPLNGLGAHR